MCVCERLRSCVCAQWGSGATAVVFEAPPKGVMREGSRTSHRFVGWTRRLDCVLQMNSWPEAVDMLRRNTLVRTRDPDPYVVDVPRRNTASKTPDALRGLPNSSYTKVVPESPSAADT